MDKPFGPFDQTDLQSMSQGLLTHVILPLNQRCGTLNGGTRPAGLGFSQFRLIFGILSPESKTHPKFVALIRKKVKHVWNMVQSSIYSREVDGQNGK